MLISFLIGLLTVVLVLDCLFLLLLILIQLPKKEAGLGQAFGSGTTDALFGAGSGTALTKMTKYAAVIFFVLVLLLSVINAHQSKSKRAGRLRDVLSKTPAAETVTPATTTASNAPVKVTVPALNLSNAPVVPTVPAPAPAAAATNAATPPAK